MKIFKAISRLFAEHSYLWYLIIFAAGFFIFGFLQSQPTFLDPDAFYHAKMAVLTKDQGIVMNFPWMPWTVLGRYYVDQHYLYHLFLVPFVAFLNPLVGLKLATVFFAALLLVTFFWLLQRISPRVPAVINFVFSLFLFLCQPLIFRINLPKASAVVLIFILIIFYLITQKKYWALFFFSFAYVYLHGGWPLILVILGFYVLASAIRNYFTSSLISRIKKLFFGAVSFWNGKLILAGVGGLLAGLVINPYFPGNLKFYWQQLVQIGIINYQSVVRVGAEWYPYDPQTLFLNTVLPTMLLVVSLVIFIISIRRQSKESWLALFLTFFFLAITLKSQRYVEYYLPFLVLFCALSLAPFLESHQLRVYGRYLWRLYHRRTFWVTLLGIFWLAGAFAIAGKDWAQNWQYYFYSGRSWSQYEKSTTWLSQNTPAGSIVFHGDWDEFPQLFYYDSNNYYIFGLDPTFLYQASPKLYQEVADITMGKVPFGLADKIKNDFKADYVFVDYNDHRQFYDYLKKDSQAVSIYRDDEVEIFKITSP